MKCRTQPAAGHRPLPAPRGGGADAMGVDAPFVPVVLALFGIGLVMVGQRLDSGCAVGLDLWRGVDQSGNTPTATMANAQAQGVSERVELRTGDMTAMPFRDAEFDVVVSSMAIHNIPGAPGRAKALEEAVRVLRPGGRIALVDFRHARDYQEVLAASGVSNLRRQGLGWRFWYGGPWTGATLLTGTKLA